MTDWKALIKQHAFGLGVAAVIVFGGRMWLQDHDARLKAESTVKQAEEAVRGLQARQTAIQKTTASRLVVLHDKAVQVDTPAKAIQATAETAPELACVKVPDAPGAGLCQSGAALSGSKCSRTRQSEPCRL
jgi:hypothetical protein